MVFHVLSVSSTLLQPHITQLTPLRVSLDNASSEKPSQLLSLLAFLAQVFPEHVFLYYRFLNWNVISCLLLSLRVDHELRDGRVCVLHLSPSSWSIQHSGCHEPELNNIC